MENFWLYSGYSFTHLREKILPSGTFELVFNLKDDELRIYKASDVDVYARFFGAIVSGPYTGFFVTDSAEESAVMGMHFRPGGAFPFLGFAADQFVDAHIDLSDIWGAAAGEIRERLFNARTTELRFRILQNVLLSRLLLRLQQHPAVSLALGDTAPNAPVQLSGFVGIAFHVTDRSHFECLYIRPKNGRSEDQLQRNHSTQYISIPGFPWDKLSSETPGKYESYVDLVPGQWTKLKIEVEETIARLYVNGAEQPTLIINDLKQPLSNGSIALWVGQGTIAHFANLKVTP